MSSAGTEQPSYVIVREFLEDGSNLLEVVILREKREPLDKVPRWHSVFQVAALLNCIKLSRLKLHTIFSLRPLHFSLRVNWYQTFNAVEAFLWAVVASVIALRAKRENNQQCFAVALGCIAFLAFGVSDLLEIAHQAEIPWWLWIMKIACGTAILTARYTWVGWSKFRWTDREFLFGLALLAATIMVIVLQVEVGSVK